MDDKEIEIENEFPIANQWKPYDFLMFIERELALRSIDHQVHDLTADLGAIKVCLKYIVGCGRKPSSFVKYCLWLFDGLDKTAPITSLAFMPSSLRHFYGNRRESAVAKKIADKVAKKMDNTAKSWLDEIRNKY